MTHDPLSSLAILVRLCDGIAANGVPPSLASVGHGVSRSLTEVYWAAEALVGSGLLCRTPDGSAIPFAPTREGWRRAGYHPPYHLKLP